ncbi:MAG: leucine-rich repeat domain-containing protein [Paludibacteraceae bacterium]|nr:leucine-rich repeat domain-containing protein [Paludibacteraceae bacterium]
MKTNPDTKAIALFVSLFLLIPISINWFTFLTHTISDDADENETPDNPLAYTVLTDSNTTFEILSDSTVAVGKCNLYQTKNISIPEKVCTRGKVYTVTSIRNNAFIFCHELTNIEIPESVNSIGESAFNCSWLTNVKIPESVEYIGNYAFEGCYILTNIEIPESVNSIGESAFHNCISLINIKIPKSVNSIGNYAFEGCSNLNVIIDNSKDKVKIGKDAFKECKSVRYTK